MAAQNDTALIVRYGFIHGRLPRHAFFTALLVFLLSVRYHGVQQRRVQGSHYKCKHCAIIQSAKWCGLPYLAPGPMVWPHGKMADTTSLGHRPSKCDTENRRPGATSCRQTRARPGGHR